MYKGISCFAGMNKNFPVEKFLKQYEGTKDKQAITFLPYTFGWEPRIIEGFLDLPGEKKLIEFHIGNGSGRRKNMLQSYEFMSKFDVNTYNKKLENMNPVFEEKLIEEFQKLDNLIWVRELTSYAEVIISPELEDNMTDLAWKNLKRVLKSCLSDDKVKFLRNPCTKGTGGGPYWERHGSRLAGAGNKYLHNMDGTAVRTKTVEYTPAITSKTTKALVDSAKEKKIKAFFIWYPEQQGYTGSQSSKLPAPRKRKFIVTDEHIALSKSILGG